MYIDAKLSLSHHISHVCSKVSRNIGVLWKIKFKVDLNTLDLLYNALILPHMSYCNIIWGCAKQTVLDPLYKLQKKVVRIITGSKYAEHTSPLFIKLNRLKVMDIHKVQALIFILKSLLYVKFPYMHSFLSPFFKRITFSHVHFIYGTRKCVYDLVGPFCRTDIRFNSIYCFGPGLWTSLPSSTRESLNLSNCKNLLTNFFISAYC